MTALDFAGVLAAHRLHNRACTCMAWSVNLRTDREVWTPEDQHRAHVAAALDAEMVAAQAEAWDEGYEVHKPRPDTNPTTNPYRSAALAQAGGGES